MPQINSSWQLWSLSFQFHAEVDSHVLSLPFVLARVRAELEGWGAAIWEPSPESFRFGYKQFSLRRTVLNMITAGEVRAMQIGGNTVVTISGSFMLSLLGGVIFSSLSIALGWPVYFIVPATGFVLAWNGFQAYSGLRKILTEVAQTSTTRAA